MRLFAGMSPVPHLEAIFSELHESVQKYQSLPLSTYVPIGVVGNESVLSDQDIEFVCAEVTFSVDGVSVRLLDRDMQDGYWYLTDAMDFAL